MGMIQTFNQAWRIPEMRKKLLFTLLILVIFRLGSNIPVPGVNKLLLTSMFNANEAGLLGLFDMFSGGSFSNFTIFALGVGPYITSSIIIQLLTVAIPALEELAKQGEEGKRKINRITRYTAVGLALIQAIGYTFGLFRNVLIEDFATVFGKIVIVLILVAGSCILMWLGEKINDKGIGNGVSLIIFAGIVSRIPTAISNTFRALSAGGWSFLGQTAEDGTKTVGILSVILFVIFALIVIVGIILVTEGTRKIPVQYAKRVVGRKMYGGQSTHIPVKVNQAGVIPIIFALSILQFPLTITYFLQSDSNFSVWVTKWLSPNGNPGVWVYAVLNFILIIAFTYFYTGITFNPSEVAENMKANGGFIPGIRPGKATEEYLSKVMNRITIVGAVFLAVIATLPTILSVLVPSLKGIHFGGTSLLIAVGVALDTVRQLENQMLMRNYQGFLK